MYTFYILDANGNYDRHITVLFTSFDNLCEDVETNIVEMCEDDPNEYKVDISSRNKLKEDVDQGDHILYYESPTMGYKYMICNLPHG